MRQFPLPARRIALILALSLITLGAGPCDTKRQPKTVADILVAAENVKNDLRSRGELTAQNDYDISAKLTEANRAYKRFIEDELGRLAAGGNQPDPSRRQAAVRALLTSLRSLEDPSVLGIKGDNARKLWREGIAGVNTVISGLEMLEGGE